MSEASREIESRISLGRQGSGLGRSAWAQRFAVIGSHPFSFEGHEYLRGIYECDAPHIAVEKAAQMGGSVFCMLDALWSLDTGRARTAIYFFPTAREVQDFSHDRVKPIISACPHLRNRIRGIDNAAYKQFLGPGGEVEAALYFRGMKSKVSTSSIPADLIVIDERDKVATADYELALKRVSHSEKALVREACTPTVADFGIDAVFERSDMRFWTIRCPRCGTENQPEKTFREDGCPDRVIYERGDSAYLGCRNCAAALDPSAGRWVADHPGRDIAGFHLSQLFSRVIQRGRPIQYAILDDFRNTRNMADFWNSRMGFPYEDRTTSVTLETLNACDGDYPMAASATACTMGVDQGNRLHAVVSEHRNGVRRVVRAAVLDSFRQLHDMMRDYDVRCCVIDGLPNTHSAREFASAFPGRVFLCFYSRSDRSEARWNESDSTVAVDRTQALDSAAASYLRRETRLPRDPLIEDVFKPQMGNMARRPIRDESDEISGYEWVKRGADHFRHADSYDQLAASRRTRDLEGILSGVVTSGPRKIGKKTVCDNHNEPVSPIDFDHGEMDRW